MGKTWQSKRRLYKVWIFGCGLTLAISICIWGISAIYSIRIISKRADNRVAVFISNGSLKISDYRNSFVRHLDFPPKYKSRFVQTKLKVSELDFEKAKKHFGLYLPRRSLDAFGFGTVEYTIPFWPIILVSGLITARAWAQWRRSRNLRYLTCSTCHYDLTGNESGTCPECGTAIAPPTNAEVAG